MSKPENPTSKAAPMTYERIRVPNTRNVVAPTEPEAAPKRGAGATPTSEGKSNGTD